MTKLSKEHEQLLSLWSMCQQLRHSMQDVRGDCNRELASMRTQLHAAAAQIQTACHKHDLVRIRDTFGHDDEVRSNRATVVILSFCSNRSSRIVWTGEKLRRAIWLVVCCVLISKCKPLVDKTNNQQTTEQD